MSRVSKGSRLTVASGTVVAAGGMTRVVEGQAADLLASVIEFSDYPEEDSDLMRRLDNGVPINVIQRPVTGLEIIKLFHKSILVKIKI